MPLGESINPQSTGRGAKLEAAMDNLGLRLTVRMGVMLAAGLTLLGAVSRIHPWTLFALMRRLFVVFAPSEPCRLR